MKRKILSLLLSFTLCLTLLPTAAFAEGPDKISITTVDELLQFAKAVDNGEYDDKTDAVVSLDADLDLTGVAWTPIGSVFAADGTLLHYFSGKFYGNGHTISNLDFSENYGKTEYPSFGFFSEVYGAEISGLTIQGKLDVSNSGYVYFGTVAGVAADSKISDCASDVSFTDTDKYINGTVALCGYAINSTIEYCQNKGNFSITKDVSSFQMGGIVGLAQNSTVQYCANTGDMTSWTPCTGGIVGQLFQNSKIINCYSTGKMVPLGNGITDFGGIAGIVGAGTEIRHCYFAGEMDLSQYTATTPYKRLGGIAGGVSSDTPAFENNYFVETENVPACFKYQDAGIEKTLDFMKTEDFFNEITAAGGNYRFNSNGTPLLPAPKYTVSFVVTPAELANVVIKVNGQEVANPVDLEAGTYTVEVSADNCEVFNLNITITADTATHTQTIAMTYLPADYTKVDEAIAKANALNKDNYMDFSGVEAAVNAARSTGHEFDSRGEYDYYMGTVLPKVQSGEVVKVELHRRFTMLPEKEYGNVKLPAAHYTPDFVLTYADGTVEVVEVKSKFTRRQQRDYIHRRRMFIDLVAEPQHWRFIEHITPDTAEEIRKWKRLAEQAGKDSSWEKAGQGCQHSTGRASRMQ